MGESPREVVPRKIQMGRFCKRKFFKKNCTRGFGRRKGSRKQNRETYPGFAGRGAFALGWDLGSLTALRRMLRYQRSHQLTARETSAISAVTVLGILAVSLHIRCRKIARKGNKREEAHCQAPGCRAIRI